MNWMTFALIYVDLALLMAFLIIYLPPVWKLGDREIVAWPLYSAWGIGWVITGLWWLYDWSLLEYLLISIVFYACFPLIYMGAQLSYKLRKRRDKDSFLALFDIKRFDE